MIRLASDVQRASVRIRMVETARKLRGQGRRQEALELLERVREATSDDRREEIDALIEELRAQRG